jgi:hypothetical protein
LWRNPRSSARIARTTTLNPIHPQKLFTARGSG